MGSEKKINALALPCGAMNRIGWRDPAPGEKTPNLHTTKMQTAFVRPEQYKDCMDLSMMLAWNAQCTNSKPEPRFPASEVYKIDKLRGVGEGTGDAMWKVEARKELKETFANLRKDARIAELQSEARSLRRALEPPPIPATPAPPPYFGKSSRLVSSDPPVAALLPHRVGSPGTFGVKKQVRTNPLRTAWVSLSLSLELRWAGVPSAPKKMSPSFLPA